MVVIDSYNELYSRGGESDIVNRVAAALLFGIPDECPLCKQKKVLECSRVFHC